MKGLTEESRLPSFVHLYHGLDSAEVSVEGAADFLGQVCGFLDIDLRGEFLSHWLENEGPPPRRRALAERFARARVRQPNSRAEASDPLPGEVDFELRFLTAGTGKPVGVLYDGHELLTLYASALPADELNPKHCHLALTNQLFATWDADDGRYHVRASVYGFPSILSTSGLVQGPARPREYYLGRTMGFSSLEADGSLKERYLDRRDPRLGEALKGYLLQALFYHVAGDPFCADRDCRLFNAHWQEDLIHAQLRPGADLCEKHRRELENWECD